MPGKMCWLSNSGTDGEKILHLQILPNEPWRPYMEVRQYAVADYLIPGGSRGWATYQKLLKQGWKLIPSDQVENSALVGAVSARKF